MRYTPVSVFWMNLACIDDTLLVGPRRLQQPRTWPADGIFIVTRIAGMAQVTPMHPAEYLTVSSPNAKQSGLRLPIDIETIKGFMDPAEGRALYDALACAPRGPCLEIGAYCGKSAVYLGAACQAAGGVLFSVDHHRGSEENQPG